MSALPGTDVGAGAGAGAVGSNGGSDGNYTMVAHIKGEQHEKVEKGEKGDGSSHPGVLVEDVPPPYL